MQGKTIVRWQVACFLLLGQIFLLVFFGRYLGSYLFFVGVGYQSDEWNILLLSVWLLYHVGYGAVMGGGLQRCRTGNSYMSIVRYGNYSNYYRKVLGRILFTTVIYDGVSLLGILLGLQLISRGGRDWMETEQLFQAAGVSFFFHWFCGMLMGVCIVKYDRAKEAMLIYPGILFWNIAVSQVLPIKVCAALPGNWLHVARSDWFTEAGYSMENAIVCSFCGAAALYVILYFGMGRRSERNRS